MNGPQDDFATAIEELRAYVEFSLSTGIEGFRGDPAAARRTDTPPPPRHTPPPAAPQRNEARPTATAPVAPPPVRPADAAPAPDLAAVATLDQLRTALGDCARCKLSGGRTHIVFGVGNPEASLMFVGEGPGRDEDLRGEPFVGRAGQLLTDIITKGMKLRREDVYIANIVKCRPPNNRDPEPDEVAACRPFVLRQIELVAPTVIVALGRVAAHAMLGTTTPISRLRGRWHEFAGIKLMPTLHPAYLLRNPADKRLVWEDIQMVMAEIGLER